MKPARVRGVDVADFEHDQRALVVDAGDARARLDLAARADRGVQRERLLSCAISVAAGREAGRASSVSAAITPESTKTRVHELGRSLAQEREFVPAGASCERVERAVARLPAAPRRRRFGPDAVEVHRHRAALSPGRRRTLGVS